MLVKGWWIVLKMKNMCGKADGGNRVCFNVMNREDERGETY